ncbi:T9SS type A sorting domain-containing protein [bacterium]|nr:T9SS type A sorting domain-containing protein [bacterium]
MVVSHPDRKNVVITALTFPLLVIAFLCTSVIATPLSMPSRETDEEFTSFLRPNFFNLVASPLDFEDEFENEAGTNLFSTIDHLQIVYNRQGDIFIPDGPNTFDEVASIDVYRIFVDDWSALTWWGDPLEPETVYPLQTGFWNWLGFPFSNPISVEDAFADIVNQVLVIMNDQGEMYIPGEINTLGELSPGRGCMIVVHDDMEFTYPPPPEIATLPTTSPNHIPPSELSSLATGLPYPILVSFEKGFQFNEPLVLSVYDGLKLVGRAQIEDPDEVTPVIAWQGNDEFELTGFTPGNKIEIRLTTTSGEKISASMSPENPCFSDFPLTRISMKPSGNHKPNIPLDIRIGRAYPNPFNSTMQVLVELPESRAISIQIYNLLGHQIYKTNYQLNKGRHAVQVDFRDLLQPSAGMYLLKVESDGHVSTQKILYLP